MFKTLDVLFDILSRKRRHGTLGDLAYRVRASFLPGPGATVADRIEDLKLHEIDLSDGAVLETNCVYIVPLLESLALPNDLAAAANPKSSTGRLDVFTRVITDRANVTDIWVFSGSEITFCSRHIDSFALACRRSTSTEK